MNLMDQRAKWKVTAMLEKRSLLVAVNILAGLAILFFGYDQGMMGGVNGSYAYVERMGFGYMDHNGDPVVTKTLLQGGIVSVYYLGTLIGCIIGGSVGDRIGRIKTLAFGALWGIFGACLQCTAMNSNWMIGARLVNGIGTGILNAIVPVWASEISEYTSRGQFIAIEFTLNIFGVVLAYWLEFGLSYIDNGRSEFQWRFPIAFQIPMLLILLASCWAFPESPRWLCLANRDNEALYVLERLRGTTGEDAGKAERELQEIQAVVELERSTKGTSYFHMLFGLGDEKLHVGRRVQLVMWLQILQDWSGIAGITMFAPTIFRIAGFASHKAQWIAGLNNIFYTFATLICVFTLDKIGRRWTLWWGAAGQALAMFLAGGFSRCGLNATAAGDAQRASQWGAGAAAMVFLYTFIFGATWLTVPWLYPAEIFPLKVRAKGNAWGVLGWSLGNGSLTLALPYIVSAIDEKTLYVFGACNVLSIPIVWALYPESNQRTLEEMDLLFAADSPWVWAAEKNFKLLKAQNPAIASHDGHRSDSDAEKAMKSSTDHFDVAPGQPNYDKD
ncbi:general substrate transporter [Lipomyces doorenjongii]